MATNINRFLLDLREIELYPERQKEIINRRFSETYEYYRIGFFKKLFFMIKFSTMKQAKIYSILLASFFFLTQLIVFSHNYYVKSELKIAKMTKEIEITKNVLTDIDRFYPGVGSGSAEIIESLLDDNYQMDIEKILDPFIEEKTRIMIELHGLQNYNLRFSDITWPFSDEDRKSAYIVDEFRYRSNNNFHGGMDIQLFNGSNITSSGDGIVKYVGESKLFGKYIIIRHYTRRGYLDTYYGHLYEFKIKKDMVVKKGQLIAKMGQTGTDCTGKHLHWEIRCYLKVGVEKVTNQPIYKLMHYNPVDNSTWNYVVRENYLDK